MGRTPSTWAAATSINAKKATNCAQLIRWALKELGVIEKNDFFYFTYNNTFKWGGSTESHLKAHAEIIPVHKRARSLIASGYLKPGDICCWHSLQHINVYAGKNKWFDAGRGGTNGHWENFGHEDQDGWEMRTYVFDKWGPVKTTYLDTQVDYIIRLPARTVSENGTGGGYRADPTAYSKAQMELIWAIVAQEDNGSYAGALAVISSAMNRTESARWKSLGSTALAQLTAPGQYCYSNDSYWRRWLGGNVPGYVKQAVWDCLKKGIPVYPGCVSPSEVAQAVKRGLKFMPTGGINAKNLEEYLSCFYPKIIGVNTHIHIQKNAPRGCDQSRELSDSFCILESFQLFHQNQHVTIKM